VHRDHSLHEKLAAARVQLVSAGIAPAEAAVDVPLFACTILGWDRVRLLTERSAAPPPALEPRFSEWISRRIAREPAAYIVGVREFWGLDFHVTPAVLIPRPETEFIVEEALEILNSFAIDVHKVADIGTGCGNIAVSLAHEVGGVRVVATDVSREALMVAGENALRYGVDNRIDFVKTSYLDGIDDTFDLIAANPPYVKDADKAGLAAAVLHEPDVALFGGSNGLRDLEAVLDAAVARLRRSGWLVMEFGYGQEDDVRGLVSARPALRLERVRADLQGIWPAARHPHRQRRSLCQSQCLVRIEQAVGLVAQTRHRDRADQARPSAAEWPP
jgi:release factor glutamine methyltransferase